VARRLPVLARLVEARASAEHHAVQGETAMPFYEQGDVRIRYEEAGSESMEKLGISDELR
jgi:hypothetical protein